MYVIYAQLAMMDKLVLETPPTPTTMEPMCMVEGWRCVVEMPTTQCVVRGGLMMMLQLSVVTWATALLTTVSGRE